MIKLKDLIKDLELGKVYTDKDMPPFQTESINEVNVGNTYISSDGEHIELVFDKFMSGKWRTIDFDLGPRPMVSGIGTSPEHTLGMYGKLKKLSSSQKNAIKKMLKNPEDIHMIKRDGQNVNKVLKALK